MNSVVKGFDSLPRIVKVIFPLPLLDILWAVYRLCRSIAKIIVSATILAIVMLILCPVLVWIVDLITTILTGKVIWLV